MYAVSFNYDFSTNAEEIFNNPEKYKFAPGIHMKNPMQNFKNFALNFRVMLGGEYGLDALGIPGRAVEISKSLGGAQNVPGLITISGKDLKKINPRLIDSIQNHPAYQDDMMIGGFDTGHGYSSPPAWLDRWAERVKFTGDLRNLWDGKTRTWNLGGKIVDNFGKPVKKTKGFAGEKARKELSLDQPIIRDTKLAGNFNRAEEDANFKAYLKVHGIRSSRGLSDTFLRMMRDNMRHHIKDGTFNPQDKKIKKS